MTRTAMIVLSAFLVLMPACGDDDTTGGPCSPCTPDAEGHACCAAEHGDLYYCGALTGECVEASGCTAEDCCIPGDPGDAYCAATYGACSSCAAETCTPQACCEPCTPGTAGDTCCRAEYGNDYYCDTDGSCVEADCSDNLTNGAETDEDCGGGSCPPCANDLTCAVATDCESGFCDGTVCAACTDHADCADLTGTFCDGGLCTVQLADGVACTEAAQCDSGHCPASDLVCCDAACDGECVACLASKSGGTDGVCEAVTVDTDPDVECSTDELCDGIGACACSLADAYEPNDTEATAEDLGALNDADPNPLPTVSGVMDTTDADWFFFTGTDAVGGLVDPTVHLTTALGVRICAYYDCVNGTPDFTCDTGTVPDTSTAGHPGCCTSTGNEVSVSLNCTGTGTDNATVYIRVDSQTAACLPYTIEYHY